MKHYHDLYLKCDILQLPDVFEKFRSNSLKNYGLCPSHYLSAPALSWDAMHYMTKVELIPDPDIYIFFENDTRGRVSYISNSYSKANNKFLKSCDPKQDYQHILYIYTQIIYMVTSCPNFFEQVDSNGQILRSLT